MSRPRKLDTFLLGPGHRIDATAIGAAAGQYAMGTMLFKNMGRREPFTAHQIVHAVEWLKLERSIYDLQERLGHTTIKTTEIYLDCLTPDEKADDQRSGVKQGSRGHQKAAQQTRK